MNDLILELIRKSGFFDGLSAIDFENAVAVSNPTECEFEKDQTLWSQEDSISDVVIVSRGTLIGRKYQPGCKAQFVRTFEQGQCVGLEALLTRRMTMPMTVAANSPGSYVRLAYRPLVYETSLPCETRLKILANIARKVADDSIRFLNKAGVLSQPSVREKALAFLTIVNSKNGGGYFDIGMNQEELAQYLCVDRSTLSENLNRLRREGIIDYGGSRFTLISEPSESQ